MRPACTHTQHQRLQAFPCGSYCTCSCTARVCPGRRTVCVKTRLHQHELQSALFASSPQPRPAYRVQRARHCQRFLKLKRCPWPPRLSCGSHSPAAATFVLATVPLHGQGPPCGREGAEGMQPQRELVVNALSLVLAEKPHPGKLVEHAVGRL